MKSRPSALLTAAFAAVFFALGAHYWRIPYAKASLPDSLYGPLLGSVLVAPVVVRLFSSTSFTKTCIVTGLAVPAMVMARVVVETLRDPTSHNLWPLEVIIASVMGLALASAGSLAGGLLARLLGIEASRGDV